MFQSHHVNGEFFGSYTLYLDIHSPHHLPLGFSYARDGVESCFSSSLLNFNCYTPGTFREIPDILIYQITPDCLDYTRRRFATWIRESNIPFRRIAQTVQHQDIVTKSRLLSTTVVFYTWKYILIGSIMLAVLLTCSQGQLIQPI